MRLRVPKMCNCSYEDNGDAVNNLVVIAQPTDKKSIEDLGSQDEFLNSVSYLLGRQAYSGKIVDLCNACL